MKEWPDFEVPAEWSLVRMEDLAVKLKAGGTPSRKDKSYFSGDIPFVLIDDMTSSGVYLRSTKEAITRKGLDACSAWIVPENAVLLSMYATIGATVITTFPVATNQAILAIIPNGDCDREYLSFCLQAHKAHLARLNVESTQKNINKGIVSAFPIPLPPRPEQKKIAHILSTVQRAIEAQQRIIKATSELKTALMHRLFAEGLRNEPQKQTDIGPIPQSWSVVEIGDVFKFTSGKTKPKDTSPERTEEHNIPVYGGNGVLGYSSQQLLEDCTLILGRVGAYCGCAHLTARRSWVTDNALYAKEEKVAVNRVYARAHFEHLNLNRYSNKMGQPLITQGIINRVKFGLPPRHEQDELADTFTMFDNQLALLGSKTAILEELFRALLHELMTAKLRVHGLEISMRGHAA